MSAAIIFWWLWLILSVVPEVIALSSGHGKVTAALMIASWIINITLLITSIVLTIREEKDRHANGGRGLGTAGKTAIGVGIVGGIAFWILYIINDTFLSHKEFYRGT